jgi:hypothetical protein
LGAIFLNVSWGARGKVGLQMLKNASLNTFVEVPFYTLYTIKKNREDAPNPFWLLVKMLQPNTYISVAQ